ncbi:MAG: protease pro-enzyme activation domain-containing protein [Candidatus Dormibacteria bacterium]
MPTALAASAAPAPMVALAASAVPASQTALRLGPESPSQTITLQFALALRNQAQLDRLATAVSTPGSPQRGQYLTPAQFSQDFGPDPAAVDRLTGWLRGAGLTSPRVSPDRTLVEVTTDAGTAERLLAVPITRFHSRLSGVDYYAADSAPVVPAEVARDLVGVQGLTDRPAWHSRLQSRSGSGPGGGLTPEQARTAYDDKPLYDQGLNGTGQAIGLFQLDDFVQANIDTWDSQYYPGVSLPAITRIPIDGGVAQPGDGEQEVELDIEVVRTVAPMAALKLWEAPNNATGINDAYDAIVTSDSTISNSTSWGSCEGDEPQSEAQTLDAKFEQAAVQGQSFFAASGDSGAYDCETASTPSTTLAVDAPADTPHMTGVGGTSLTTNSDDTYSSESAWCAYSTTPVPAGCGTASGQRQGTGGGLSTYFPLPSWQTGPGVANSYSTGERQVPDISADADPGTAFSTFLATTAGQPGHWLIGGGTSAAAPFMAGLTAQMDAWSALNCLPQVGFLAPTLYSLGTTPPQFAPFHDVTTGTNLYYPSTTGWDYPTGWGSPDVWNLVRDLSGSGSAALGVTSVSPSLGDTAGGLTLTINGCGFRQDTTQSPPTPPAVTLGGVALSPVTFVSATQLTVTSPAHLPGPVSVQVSNPPATGGTGPVSRTNAFTYQVGGYVVDAFGGLHPFGDAPAASTGSTSSTPIFRDVARVPDRPAWGYTLDGYGLLHPFGGAPAVDLSDCWASLAQGCSVSFLDIARGVSLNPYSLKGFITGYVVDAYGGVHTFVQHGSRWSSAVQFPHIHIQDYWGAPQNGGHPDHPNWDIVRGMAVYPDNTGGYAGSGFTLDGYGGVHPFWVDDPSSPSTPPPATAMSDYWGDPSNGGDPTAPNFDIARAITLNPVGYLGYVTGYTLDGYGGAHGFMDSRFRANGFPTANPTGYAPGQDIFRSIFVLFGAPGLGYTLDSSGAVHPFSTNSLPRPPAESPFPAVASGYGRGIG